MHDDQDNGNNFHGFLPNRNLYCMRLWNQQSLTRLYMLFCDVDIWGKSLSDLEREVVGIALPTLKKQCGCLGVTSDQILLGVQSQDRGMVLSSACNALTDEQFALLLEIVNCYVKAAKL